MTPPLTADVTVAGDVITHLYTATTGSDADWVVKLIDVYPDTVPERPVMGGYKLMVTVEIMRGRAPRRIGRACTGCIARPGIRPTWRWTLALGPLGRGYRPYGIAWLNVPWRGFSIPS